MNPSYYENSDKALTKFLSEPETNKTLYNSDYEPKGILLGDGVQF